MAGLGKRRMHLLGMLALIATTLAGAALAPDRAAAQTNPLQVFISEEPDPVATGQPAEFSAFVQNAGTVATGPVTFAVVLTAVSGVVVTNTSVGTACTVSPPAPLGTLPPGTLVPPGATVVRCVTAPLAGGSFAGAIITATVTAPPGVILTTRITASATSVLGVPLNAAALSAASVALPPFFATAGAIAVGDPIFNRPVGGSDATFCALTGAVGNAVRFDTYTVNAAAGQLYLNASVRGADSGGGTLSDPFVVIYQGSFNPATPCANLVAADDDGGIGFDSNATVLVPPAGGTYVIVVTTFANTTPPGTYTLLVSRSGTGPIGGQFGVTSAGAPARPAKQP